MAKKVRAITPEARTDQLISMAYDLAEERMMNGTASSQEIVHFLKLGTERTRLENAKMEEDIELSKAKRKSIDSAVEMEQLAANAIKALTGYQATQDDENDDDLDEEYDDEY